MLSRCKIHNRKIIEKVKNSEILVFFSRDGILLTLPYIHVPKRNLFSDALHVAARFLNLSNRVTPCKLRKGATGGHPCMLRGVSFCKPAKSTPFAPHMRANSPPCPPPLFCEHSLLTKKLEKGSHCLALGPPPSSPLHLRAAFSWIHLMLKATYVNISERPSSLFKKTSEKKLPSYFRESFFKSLQLGKSFFNFL
jgi:hypothetical protein